MKVLWRYVYIKSKPRNVGQLYQRTPFSKLYVTILEPSTLLGHCLDYYPFHGYEPYAIFHIYSWSSLYNFRATLKPGGVYEEMRCHIMWEMWMDIIQCILLPFKFSGSPVFYSQQTPSCNALWRWIEDKSKGSHLNETFFLFLINTNWKANSLNFTAMCVLNMPSTNPNLLLPVFHINIYQPWTLGRLHPVLCQTWNHIHCSSLYLCAGEMGAA